MNEEEFNEGIGAIKEKNLPDCPSSLEDNVLRRVRLAKSPAEGDFWSWLGMLIPQTGFVVGALALVIAVSSVVTYASASAYAASVERRIEMNKALDLGFVKSTRLLDLTNIDKND